MRLAARALFFLFVIMVVFTTIAHAAPRWQPPFRKVWLTQVQPYVRHYVVLGDCVYYQSDHSLGALRWSDGKKLWRTEVEHSTYHYSLAHDGKLWFIYANVYDKSAALRVYNFHDGTLQATVPIGQMPRCTAAADGVAYIGCADGSLVAMEGATGQTRWTVPRVDASRLVLLPDAVIAGTRDGRVPALAMADGQVLWEFPAAPEIDAVVTPEKNARRVSAMITDGAHLYVAYADKRLAKLRVTDGGVVWEQKLAAPCESLLLQNGLLWLMGSDKRLQAVTATDGKPQYVVAVPPRYLDTDKLLAPAPGGGVCVVGGDDSVIVIDAKGRRQWTWQPGFFLQQPPHLLPGGDMLLADMENFRRFTPGAPPALPTIPAARRALAKQLAARYGQLNADEMADLVKLGPFAFEALLQHHVAGYKIGYQPRREPVTNHREFRDVILGLMRPADTGAVVQAVHVVMPRGDVRYTLLFDLLLKKGDRRAVPFMIMLMQRERVDNYRNALGRYAEFIKRTPDARLDAFLLAALRDPKAPDSLRDQLGTSGLITSEAGARALLQWRNTQHNTATAGRRTLAPLEEYLPLKWLRDTPDPTGYKSSLSAMYHEPGGATWGLFVAGLSGCHDDLWVAQRVRGRWEKPLFTGARHEQELQTTDPGAALIDNSPLPPERQGTMVTGSNRPLADITPEKKPDWFKDYIEDGKLEQDSDGDGWTDLLEQRLGTDPQRADTDGDGLIDSRDRNPQAAPRALGDIEKQLIAAFEERFRGSREAAPCLVELPAGVAPFEFRGSPWAVLLQPDGAKAPLAAFSGYGLRHVRFGQPYNDFDGNRYQRAKNAPPGFVLWNRDRTLVRFSLHAYYGNLGADGSDVMLRKVGDEWVVVEYRAVMMA